MGPRTKTNWASQVLLTRYPAGRDIQPTCAALPACQAAVDIHLVCTSRSESRDGEAGRQADSSSVSKDLSLDPDCKVWHRHDGGDGGGSGARVSSGYGDEEATTWLSEAGKAALRKLGMRPLVLDAGSPARLSVAMQQAVLHVAVKRLQFSSLVGQEQASVQRRQVLLEAELNAGLSHRNLMATYAYHVRAVGDGSSDQGVRDWVLQLVCELCSGGSLYDAMAKGRLTAIAWLCRLWDTESSLPVLGLVLAIMGDVADAMVRGWGRPGCQSIVRAYVHSRNILHMDLKPENVLLKPEGSGLVAKVADLGLSAVMGPNRTHLSKAWAGTPLYRAPEGVMAWELLHGCFAAQRLQQLSLTCTQAPPPSLHFTNVAGPGSCLVYNGSGHLALQPHGSGSMTVQSDEADSDSEDEEEVGSRQATADMETTFGENEEEEEGSELGSEPVQLYAIPPKGCRAALVPASDVQQHVDSAKQELAATADAVPSDEDFLERLAIVKARYCMDATLANGQRAPALLDQQKLSAQQSAFVEVMRCQAEHRVELSSAAANPAKETTKLWRYLAGQPNTKADILEYIKLAELALVMTPGSVEEERMFSDMAYLKDDTRNRLQECHLNVTQEPRHLLFLEPHPELFASHCPPHPPRPTATQAQPVLQSLQDLVHNCLQHQPQARPTFSDLVQRLNVLAERQLKAQAVGLLSVDKMAQNEHGLHGAASRDEPKLLSWQHFMCHAPGSQHVPQDVSIQALRAKFNAVVETFSGGSKAPDDHPDNDNPEDTPGGNMEEGEMDERPRYVGGDEDYILELEAQQLQIQAENEALRQALSTITSQVKSPPLPPRRPDLAGRAAAPASTRQPGAGAAGLGRAAPTGPSPLALPLPLSLGSRSIPGPDKWTDACSSTHRRALAFCDDLERHCERCRLDVASTLPAFLTGAARNTWYPSIKESYAALYADVPDWPYLRTAFCEYTGDDLRDDCNVARTKLLDGAIKMTAGMLLGQYITEFRNNLLFAGNDSMCQPLLAMVFTRGLSSALQPAVLKDLAHFEDPTLSQAMEAAKQAQRNVVMLSTTTPAKGAGSSGVHAVQASSALGGEAHPGRRGSKPPVSGGAGKRPRHDELWSKKPLLPGQYCFKCNHPGHLTNHPCPFRHFTAIEARRRSGYPHPPEGAKKPGQAKSKPPSESGASESDQEPEPQPPPKASRPRDQGMRRGVRSARIATNRQAPTPQATGSLTATSPSCISASGPTAGAEPTGRTVMAQPAVWSFLTRSVYRGALHRLCSAAATGDQRIHLSTASTSSTQGEGQANQALPDSPAGTAAPSFTPKPVTPSLPATPDTQPQPVVPTILLNMMSSASDVKPLTSLQYSSSSDDRSGVQRIWFTSLYKQLNYISKIGAVPTFTGRQRPVFELVEQEFEGLYTKYVKGQQLDEQSQRSLMMCCLAIATYRVLNDELGDTKMVREIIRTNLGGLMVSLLLPVHRFKLWLLRYLFMEDMYQQALRMLPALTADMGRLCSSSVVAEGGEGSGTTLLTVHKCRFHEVLTQEDAPFLLTEFCCHQGLQWLDAYSTAPSGSLPPHPATAPSQPGRLTAASEPGPSTPPPAKRSKHTKAEQVAEPTQPTKGTGKGRDAKPKTAPQSSRWVDPDCNAALNMQRIGKSKCCPLELCWWPGRPELPAEGKEYPELGYKRLQDRPPSSSSLQHGS
ncbi:hypothetical protein QJQ45_016887, partial [Haematococcus lacustris]